MEYYTSFKDVTHDTYKKRKTKNRDSKPVSETIYSFDIEVSSLFNIDDTWRVFDYSIEQNEYKDIEKIAIPYIWQFGCDDKVYYGREFMDFYKILTTISDKNINKIIWVHSLSYEFQFLLNIIDFYNLTIENMVARDLRKPISFTIKELNITFRCSYMLTNMSLDVASKEYTSVQKKIGQLDYDAKVRTPLSKLSDSELEYAEYDIICLYEIVKYFKGIYKHLALIPLTSTGRVREKIRKAVDYYYIKKMQELVPTSKMYLKMWGCFAGGYTHSNIINTKRVIKNAKGKDIASSYPYILTQKLPSEPFVKCLLSEFCSDDNFAYIAKVKFYNVKSNYFNHYMQVSKCINAVGLSNDNGRVSSVDYCEMWLTDVDFRIIQKNYNFTYELVECYKSFKKYLDKRIIKLILELYTNKTKYKGVKGKEAIYKSSKEFINSIYGMAVTNPLKQSTDFKNGEWSRKALTVEFIDDKIKDMQKSYSTLMFYGAGIFVTALARKRLFDIILSSHEFDRHMIYSDTDSIKYFEDYEGQFEDVFKADDQKIYDSYVRVNKAYPEIKIDDFIPHDVDGVAHPLGMYEPDGVYEEFLTLGAKKYCYRENGKLKMTLAGVSKKSVKYLYNDINNFKVGKVFGYKESGKMTHLYNDNQPEVIVDGYKCSLKYSIVLYPTTYTLGTTEIYDALWDYFYLKEHEKHE